MHFSTLLRGTGFRVWIWALRFTAEGLGFRVKGLRNEDDAGLRYQDGALC